MRSTSTPCLASQASRAAAWGADIDSPHRPSRASLLARSKSGKGSPTTYELRSSGRTMIVRYAFGTVLRLNIKCENSESGYCSAGINGEARVRVKLMAFLTKRQDLSRDQFKKLYETRHVPNILEVMPGIIEYRRNFMLETVSGVDVVTELVFPDQKTFDSAMAVAHRSPASDVIAKDQEMLFDPSGIRIFVVDEHGGAVVGANS